MSPSNKQDLLKTITVKDVMEICKHNGLRGYSSLKQKDLINFAAENLKLTTYELESIVTQLQEARLIAKIKDSEDFILRKAVNIESYNDELIMASVDNLKVKIYNIGTDDFSYTCDGKCKDYIYHVRSGKSTFCKHYPAVIGELICQEKLSNEANDLSGKKLNALLEIVEKRKKEDGIIISDDRNVENTLKNLKSDLIEISRKNTVLSRRVGW